MDPALKKRLIGASVLIVLAIIFLPMLFDGSGEPIPGNAVPLDIPAQPERDFETRVVPLDLPQPAAGVAEAIGLPSDAANPAPAPAAAADTTLATAPPPAEDPIAAVAAEAAARVDAVSGERVDNAEASDNVAAVKPVEPAPLAAVPAPTSTPTAAGRFMVNLGSYANVANASQLESSLRAAGLSVRSDALVVDGKPVRRLRLGPYATRAQADNARLKAKATRADLPASIIEVDDTPSVDVPARAVAPKGASAYAVQVAVLSDVAKANERRDAMRQAGFAAFVEKLDTAKGAVYRLRIGPEAERGDAEKIRAAVQQKFGGEAIIVDYP
jgi:DedD protein